MDMPMKLIADSGATTTSWAMIKEDEVQKDETGGFNPYYMGEDALRNILARELDAGIRGAAVTRVFYYGSGCSTENNCNIVRSALAESFPGAGIEVQHDLLGAARALLGRSKGIACILGTGANSCAYDGNRITANVPSLGYMFGDEGSGAYIGRKFLGAYLKKELAPEIMDAFDQEYHYSLEDILGSVYNTENPSAYMASFTRFLAGYEHHESIRRIIFTSFEEFFRESVSKYEGYQDIPVSFVGSVAFHFRHILGEAAWHFGITIGTIEQAPLDGLVRYHSRFGDS
jgi:N-acetylglucosamine kinase-like BadF-type ATPase